MGTFLISFVFFFILSCASSIVKKESVTSRSLEITKSDTIEVINKAEELLNLLEITPEEYYVKKVLDHNNIITFLFQCTACGPKFDECKWRLLASDGKFFQAFIPDLLDINDCQPRDSSLLDTALISKCRKLADYTVEFYGLEKIYKCKNRGYLRFFTISTEEAKKYPIEDFSYKDAAVLEDAYLNFFFVGDKIIGFITGRSF